MPIEEDIQQPQFRNARQKAAINLVFTANWLLARQKDFFEAFGITNQQFNILRILRGQHPAKISGVDIKSRMIDPHSDISRLLDRLAIKELILRSPCREDKRAADVAITRKGLTLLREIDKDILKLDHLLEAISEEEATQLSNLLDKSRS